MGEWTERVAGHKRTHVSAEVDVLQSEIIVEVFTSCSHLVNNATQEARGRFLPWPL